MKPSPFCWEGFFIPYFRCVLRGLNRIFNIAMPIRYVLLLLGIFAVTIAIRWPNIGRPMSKHHEFCTATALRVLTVWHEEGIGTKGFNPATNFHGRENKHINNHASGSGQMVDAEGNYYYVSHPPLAYYLPYAGFYLLGLEPDVVPLQVFHLFINFFCGLGVYALARKILPSNDWVGVLAAMVYWFLPATLWFQSNVYMSDMMAQPFYIAALWFALKVLQQPKPSSVVALSLVCFLGTYTTWFGLLVAGGIGIYVLASRPRRWPYICLGLMVSQIIALALMAWQYSQIAGWDAYGAELLQRFALRGGSDGVLLYLLILAINYGANYGLVLVVAFIGLFYLKNTNIPWFKAFLWMALLPIVLMHVLLANYSGHDFTTLYLAVPLSIGMAVAATQAYHMGRKELLAATLLTVLVLGPVIYVRINPYGDTSYHGDKYSAQYDEAQLLKRAPTNAVLFVIGTQPSPEALWYAKRNVKKVSSQVEALAFLSRYGHTQGVLWERVNGVLQQAKTISLLPNPSQVIK